MEDYKGSTPNLVDPLLGEEEPQATTIPMIYAKIYRNLRYYISKER